MLPLRLKLSLIALPLTGPTLSDLRLSTLPLIPLLSELELLPLRLCALDSDGSCGLRPLARAKRLSISVNDTTPDRCPDRFAPGSAAAETVVAGGAAICEAGS